jgi:small subunit ribosomal protein S20
MLFLLAEAKRKSSGEGSMPHTKSAKKNLRKSLKRRKHNRSVKRDIKIELKAFDDALEGPADKILDAYKKAAKRLDKAAAKHIIHANLAARKKSQLARAMHAKAAAAQGGTPPAPAAKK